MPDIKKNEELSLDDSIKTAKDGKPILGVLQGPCADFIKSTRNGRKYDESLWEKVFNDPIIKEYFDCGGIPGELDHPTDRTETVSEKIAIMMPEPPTKDKDGHLIASFDILDTPNGRIAYTLAKYGYKLGISSRGSGDTYTDYDGNESVDPETYDFQAFDLVLLPAVKDARMQLVTESLSNGGFKKAINEALSKSNEDDKKIMTETLSNLNIHFSADKAEDVNIDADSKHDTADNDGVDVVRDLQQALKENKALEAKIIKLQENLSVCYAKEEEYGAIVEKYRTTLTNLSEANKSVDALKKRNSIMSEKLKAHIQKLSEKDSSIRGLQESISDTEQKQKRLKMSLSEDLSKKEEQIHTLESRVKGLAEDLRKSKSESASAIRALKESAEDAKKDSAIKISECEKKVSRANSLVEKYRTVAKAAVDKYIESQAIRIGVKPVEIRNKLQEGYSFNDIDSICEGLQDYKISISKLPFDTAREAKKVRMTVTESKETIIPASGLDDDIDDSLKGLAGIK